MVDKMANAQQAYDTLCKSLDRRGWKYGKDEAEFVVHFGVNGDDIPMNFIIAVDAERQLVRLMSPLLFKINADKRRVSLAMACSSI